MSVTFKLRPEAKFADGTPLTADDVVFSFETLKTKGHPLFAQTLADVVKAEALDPHTVRYTFNGRAHARPAAHRGRAADLLQGVLRQAAISPRRRSIRRSAPVPTWSATSSKGRTIVYKRNPDYWAKDLPVNRGRWNFDEIRFEYFRDRTAGMEAFKAGTYDFREEFTSKVWATEYDFPAIRAGKVKKEVLPDETPVRHARLLPQYAARAVEGPARAQRRSTSPSISSGPTAICSTRSTPARRASSRTPP